MTPRIAPGDARPGDVASTLAAIGIAATLIGCGGNDAAPGGDVNTARAPRPPSPPVIHAPVIHAPVIHAIERSGGREAIYAPGERQRVRNAGTPAAANGPEPRPPDAASPSAVAGDAAGHVTAWLNEAAAIIHDSGQTEDEKRLRLRLIVDAYYDVEGMAAYVLGERREQLTASEWSQFVFQFRDNVLVDPWIERLAPPREGRVLDVVATVSADAGSADAAVPYRVRGQIVAGSDNEAHFRQRIDWIVLDPGRDPRIIDIVTSGISAREVWRSALAARRRGGFAALIRELQVGAGNR